MASRKLIIVTALGIAAFARSANANYTGIEIVNVDEYFLNNTNPSIPPLFAPDGHELYDVYRIFARFTGNTAADRVNAVFGSASNPAFINLTSGTIYNVIDGTGTPDDPLIHYDLRPSTLGGPNLARAFETWAT